MTELPSRGKAPHNVNVLQRWLGETAQQTGVAAGRLRRWMGFMVVAAMLDRARHVDDGEPLFLIKGGVAMELRVGVGARATKDLDAAFRDTAANVADRLDLALRGGFGDFTATRTEIEPIKDTGALRCEVKLAYRGRPVVTVKTEIAAAEAGMGSEIDYLPAASFDHLGFTGPATVACVAVRWQLAQKLHACTETFPDRDNDRFRDLLDLQLLAELVGDDQWAHVRAACRDVFDGRAKHPWPPVVTVPAEWAEGYRALAQDTGFPVADVDAAADAVRVLITRIASAS
jgi:hypothetical protein